jgi:hypothetical protein
MTTPHYDGTTPLQPALAELCGCSVKSQSKLADLIKQAKDALGIAHKTGKAHSKLETQQRRLSIWQWHKDRTTTNDAPETVDIFLQSPSKAIESPHDTDNAPTIEPVETLTTKPVDSVLQDNETAERYDMNALIKVAFYTATYSAKKRQVIGLDGFYLNALMSATGINKKGIPAWIQQAVNDWTAFDDKLPITKQVKLLIVRELEKHIDRRKAGNHQQSTN